MRSLQRSSGVILNRSGRRGQYRRRWAEAVSPTVHKCTYRHMRVSAYKVNGAQDRKGRCPMGENMSTPLVCPRCQSQMLAVKRFAVDIDQCTGCGGIFLDRGELEQLSAAEAQFYASQRASFYASQRASEYSGPQPTVAPQPPAYGGRPAGFLGGLFGGEHYGGGYGGHQDRRWRHH